MLDFGLLNYYCLLLTADVYIFTKRCKKMFKIVPAPSCT